MKLKLLLLIIVTISLIILAVHYYPKFFSQEQSLISEKGLDGKYDTTKQVAYFHGQKIPIPQQALKNTDQDILGKKSKSSNSKERVIKIDLTEQKLYAYEGNNKVMSFPVSTGKWSPTPTGEFKIWIKLNYVLMKGGSQALGTYYYLPNVPYTMFFYNDSAPKTKGYGIHGTYWHNNFGHPMSHGCVNMKTEDAKELFNWASVNTRVVIYGDTPTS